MRTLKKKNRRMVRQIKTDKKEEGEKKKKQKNGEKKKNWRR